MGIFTNHSDPLPDGTHPGVDYDSRKHTWFTTTPWPFHITEGVVTVPAGMLSDLASVPKLLRVLPGFDCFECGGAGPPIFHDACYQAIIGRTPPIVLSRRRVDQAFRRMMRTNGVGPLRAWTVWAAVRVGGWWAWRRLPSRESALRLAG